MVLVILKLRIKVLAVNSVSADISLAPLQVHYYLEALLTTALNPLMLCCSLHAEALQATMSEGLAQDPYMATRVGFEPATLRTQGTEPTTEPPCPTLCYDFTITAIRSWIDTKNSCYM